MRTPGTAPGIARRDWHRARRGATGTVCALVLLALAPAIAQAGVGASAAPAFPTSATVGDAGLPASIKLSNGNYEGDVLNTNTVCNFGDPDPCMGEPGITLIPSCGRLGPSSSCTPAGADPGVFRISDTATGAAGTACGGMVFLVTPADATFGQVRFTPQAAHVSLPGTGAGCRINFTVDVLRAPAVDQSPDPGLQTVQVVDNTQHSGGLTASAAGTSSGVTVIPPPTPPPTPPTAPPTTPPTTAPQTTAAGVAPAPAATPDTPRIGVRGAPSKCTGSSFKLRVTAQVAGLTSVRVTLDGKTIARSKKGRFNVRVNARATEFGRHVLRVIAQGASGETARTVTFKRCGRATLPRFVG